MPASGTSRDSQRARLYAWENREIAPRDASRISFQAAQGVVDAIWAELGLSFPPEVVRLPRQSRVLIADASRLRIRLADATPSWCILHELAHALSSTHDGRSDGHGPVFVGLYVELLVRYLRLPGETLLESLRRDGIKVDTQARPIFLDETSGQHQLFEVKQLMLPYLRSRRA